MKLSDYLSGKTKPAPKTTDWLPLCTFTVTSGQLWAGDPHCANADDGCITKVPRGTYVVEAKGRRDGRYRFVSHLRVRLKTATNPVAGAKVGETGTDSAMIGVSDIKAFDTACRRIDDDKVQEMIEAQTAKGFGVIKIKRAANAAMPFIPTGSDGVGPVIALMWKGKRVGIELSFMGEEEAPTQTVQEKKTVSLIGSDTPTFKTWPLATGGEASCWVGGELKPAVPISIWSSAEAGPVAYRVRSADGKVIHDWKPMAKKGGGGASFGALQAFPAGSYQIDFKIGEETFSALQLNLR